jgi:hypothetical protein
MNYILIPILLSFIFLFSCGFNSNDDEQSASGVDPVITINELDPYSDYDGDLVNNQEELNLGRNPYIADVPEINFKFMRQFTLKSLEKTLIDSQRDIIAKKHDYRVGDYLIKEISQKATTRFARFGGVVEGEFEEVDLTRIRYPKFSKNFLLEQNNRSLGDINDLAVSFTNTISLKRNRGYQKISNPTFNFHIFNYESGKYDLIGQRTIEKEIFEGVLEKFEISLEEIPSSTVLSNLYDKGEFLTAEIENFEISDLKTTYKALLKSVKEKTVPVTVITPLETKTYYVTLRKGHNQLGHFLKSLYGDNFKVQSGKLNQIGGFQNNLSDIVELRSLKGETKKGKWFVLVNKAINFNLFDYEFQKGDQIVLNYMTGDQLAGFEREHGLSYAKNYESKLDYEDIELGEFALNDTFALNLKPNHIRYEYYNVGTYGFNDSAGHTSWRFHDQAERKDELNFSRVEVLDRLALIINGKEFKVKSLIEENKLESIITGPNISLKVNSFASAFDLASDDFYTFSLRVYPNNYTADIGLWVTSIGGWIAGQSRCNSADAVCKGWYRTNGIPLGRVCSHIQPSFTNECTGVLKGGYRKRSKVLRRDLNFDYSFLFTRRFN